jgi:hypothetical protein
MYKNSKYFDVVTSNVQKTRLFLKYFYISGRKAFPPGNNQEQDGLLIRTLTSNYWVNYAIPLLQAT